MYNKLLAYAKTFGRSETIKDGIATSLWTFRHSVREEPVNANFCRVTRVLSDMNLFKTVKPHPVEKALELAKYASDDNDVEEFKRQRNIVLAFLELKCQRIVTARKPLADLIEEQSKVSGFINRQMMTTVYDSEQEKTDKAFDRDPTQEIKILVKLHERLFDSYYKREKETREHKLEDCYKIMRSSQILDDWRSSFEEATQDMKERHLQIQATRKALLLSDLESADTGFDIVTEKRWKNVLIRWTEESEDDSDDSAWNFLTRQESWVGEWYSIFQTCHEVAALVKAYLEM
ncbi:uncharacterized protein LY89DRAFT_731371 [Mollisia scopiformis]|uniref:Uncharacterized protein n=1 Tax=Mollisia scopiformis TaxID=149040 RepID=A0A194XK28_MOLSC|nr:uncharacterized protein LY89DRAFT_731371 [Mollisia scopiformis]KUJ20142.1 hypothetical protein LY89DRAFT_731371 [Mollisia scopiformis]